MRIVKPHGRSVVRPGPSPARQRVLRPTDTAAPERPIPAFAAESDDLVIAQWISAIDKIARKPQPKKPATPAQRDLRDRIGNAAWALIEREDLLPGLNDPDRRARLEALWFWKLHPYPKATKDEKSADKRGGTQTGKKDWERAKGRWYDRFADGTEPDRIDPAAIARRIRKHLYESACRLHPDRPPKRAGLIPARAQSIAGNVLAPSPGSEPRWDDTDEADYRRPGDVAAAIRAEVQKQQAKNPNRPLPAREVHRIAAERLFAHYAALFKDDAGAAQSLEAARRTRPGLLALHMAAKDAYRRLLKGSRKKRAAETLPKNIDAVIALIGRKRGNRRVNALIRLGRIVHYHGADMHDGPGWIAKPGAWPGAIDDSRFWGSDGQAEIKRDEAFLRVWRHGLALAARTLTDWADPARDWNEDILGSRFRQRLQRGIDRDAYRRKAALLFGAEGERLFVHKARPDLEKAILLHALDGLTSLRHTAFHFRGPRDYQAALEALGDDLPAPVAALWDGDVAARGDRLKATLDGAHAGFFFQPAQLEAILRALTHGTQGAFPLPRFRALLRRAKSTAGEDTAFPRLPDAPNRLALEAEPARLCQYTTLKLLYEGPFRAWLEGRDGKAVNGWIKKAVHRTTERARDQNAKAMSDHAKSLIKARAERLPRPAGPHPMARFLFDLTAATASEMRVQNAYQPNADKAREQADFIENLKRDVVALAFKDYLLEANLGFVLDLDPGAAKPQTALCAVMDIAAAPPARKAESWQKGFYFLLHLIPPDDAGRLLHQLRKWTVLNRAAAAEGTDASQDETPAPAPAQAAPEPDGTPTGAIEALELYLAMHDAKHEGGAAIPYRDELKELFENPADFDRVFPAAAPGQAADQAGPHVPRRGLRELLRFGDPTGARAPRQSAGVASRDVDAWLKAEAAGDGPSPIAQAQAERERLHDKWARGKETFAPEDLQAYARALATVVRHRQRAARVTLGDTMRLHRLTMAVLGRLVDYAGLFERDLYFVTLALMHERGLAPDAVFDGDQLALLTQGRVLEALGRDTHSAGKDILAELEDIFGGVSKGGAARTARKARNDFAHFNMLRGDGPLDLTHWVNRACALMAYDRKLKNAVSKSIKELLAREGLELCWTMAAHDGPHALGDARVTTRHAIHFKGRRVSLTDAAGKQGRSGTLAEPLHTPEFAQMVAALFGDQSPAPDNAKGPLDVTRLDDAEIDTMVWKPREEKRGKRSQKGGRKRDFSRSKSKKGLQKQRAAGNQVQTAPK